jgi:hypothetical protein
MQSQALTHDQLVKLSKSYLPIEVKDGIEDIVRQLIDKGDLWKACAIRGHLVQLLGEDDYTLQELEEIAAAFADGLDFDREPKRGREKVRLPLSIRN